VLPEVFSGILFYEKAVDDQTNQLRYIALIRMKELACYGAVPKVLADG
jgi:hypothetical protein